MSYESNNLHELYQEIILDHNKRPRHYGVLNTFTDQVEGFNPLCGDKLQIYLQLEAGTLIAISYECAACAICKASSSIMCEELVNNRFQDCDNTILDGLQLLDHHQTKGQHSNGDLKALEGVHKFPARINCAKLPWITLRDYFTNKD